jgi:hypothetical protein
MAFSQFMSRPKFYGTLFGRAWAHVFWLGFLLFIYSLITLFSGYVTHHKNSLIRSIGKYQVIGMVAVTAVVGIMTLATILMGNEALTEYDGGARRGVFALWLLLIVTFTITNLLTLFIRQLTQRKRF